MRQFFQSLRTFRGLFHLGFIVVMLLYSAGSMYFFGKLTADSAQITGSLDKMQNDFLTLGLFGATCYVILFSTGEATVFFTASEVAFLFPAPLTRQQLLSYKLLKSLLGIAAISILLSLFTSTRISLAAPRWIGTLLTISFLQLLTMNVAFARQVLQEKMQLHIRRFLGFVVGILILVAVRQMIQSVASGDLTAYLRGIQQSTVGSWMLAPFQVFTKMLRAADLVTFVCYGSIVMAVDALLLLLAFQLDGLSLEAAFVISEKMTTKIKLMQTKGIVRVFGAATSHVAKRRIPQLPFWGGIGPIIWQKMTTTFRSSTQLFWTLGGVMLLAAGVVYTIASSKSGSTAAPLSGIGVMAYMSLLISLTMQNEIERVGHLKSLPIRSISIVLGELLGFVVLLSTIQSLFIATVACIFPQQTFWLLVGALLTLPLNFLLFAIDKLVFYFYPTRLAKGAPGDFQNSGKQMIFMAMKMLMIGGSFLIVILATLPGALILNSPPAAVASAAVVLLIECAILVPLLVTAFDRFDPSVTLVT